MKDKIKDWLLKGGLPLEMKFSRALLKGGFEVAQSVYYRDPETDKFRETDIVASKYERINETWIHLTFVIECKKSTDKPWVILKNERLSNSIDNLLPIYHTDNASNFINASNKNEYKSPLLFRNDRNLGYSVQTAFNNGSDRSYESIQSVTKACEYFAHKVSQRSKVCAFYFPVVLVDGTLCEASYLEEEIEIDEVNYSEILITRSFHEFGNAHIHIFDNSNLKEVVKRLDNLSNEFFAKYKHLLENQSNSKIDKRAFG